jgi:hypothetical protein
VSGIVCFTSFTCAYLPRARVLAQTLRQAEPDWCIWALLVDKPPPGLANRDAFADFDHVIEAEALGLPRFRSWMFKHNVVEACTAMKAAMMQYLFGIGAETVVYFDPDIAVFHSLAPLKEMLATASIVMTPHQTAPDFDAAALRDNEMTSLRVGVYNLGFIAVRNDAVGQEFTRWWAGLLREACYEESASGRYTDQKYCDLVPALFERVAIARDPGWNVASWNLSRRRIRLLPCGDIVVNDSRLRFYHFSKIGGAGDVMTDRYAGDNYEVLEIWNWYKRRLAANAIAGMPEGWWHYGTFSDGQSIPAAVRLFYRERPDLMEHFDDPFDVSGDSLRAWLQRERPELLRAG